MRLRFIRIAGLTVGGLVIAGVALLHTPPMKRFALAKLQRALAAQGVRLEASGLDFNLLTLQASMHGVVVQPESSLPPLAKVDSLDLKLSLWELLRGRFVISRGSLRHPELWIVINAQGLSNLPKSKDSSGQSLEYLVEDLKAAGGALSIDDQRDGLKIVLPQWDLQVTGSHLTNRHKIEFDAKAPGSATIDRKTYPVDTLRALLTTGKNDLRVEELTLRTPGASLSGTVALLDFDRLGLNGKLVLDAQPAAFVPGVSGDFHAEIALSGTAKAPLVSARVQAANAAWQTYRDINGDATLAYDPQAQAVTASQLSVASRFGTLHGTGRLSLLPSGPSNFQGTVQQFQIRQFVPSLHSTASGTVRAQWKGVDAPNATGAAAITLVATRAPAKDAYPVAGNFRVERLSGGNTVVHVDRAALSGIESKGTIHIDRQNQLSGELAVSTPNVAAQPYSKLPVSGAVTMRLNLGGTISKPSAAFTFDAAGLTADTVKGIRVAAAGTVTAERLDLETAAVQWGGQTLAASGWVGLTGPSAPLSLHAQVQDARIPDLLKVLGQPETPVAGVVNLTADLSGTIDRPAGFASLSAAGLEAYGEKLGRLTATARFDSTSASIPDLLLDKSPQERLQGKGTYHFQSQRLSASLASTPFQLAQGKVSLQLEAAGSVPHPEVSASLQGDVRDLGPLQVQARLDGQALHATATAARQNAKAEIRATTAGPYPFTLQLQAAETDLATLSAFVPQSLEGKLSASATATGNASQWQQADVAVRAEKLAIRLDGQPIQTEGPLAATLRNGTVDLQPFTLLAPGTRLTASGQIPGALRMDGAVDLAAARAALRPADTSQESAAGQLTLAGIVESTLQSGRYRFEPQLDLSLANAAYSSPSLPPLTAATMQARLASGRLLVHSLAARWAGATISGKAEVPLGLLPANLPFDLTRTPGPATASLSVKDIDFAQFKALPSTTAGSASFTVNAESPRPELEALRAELRVDDFRLRAGKFTLTQDAPSVLRAENGTMRVERFHLTGPESNITLTGTANFTGSQALQLRLDSTLNLGLLSAFTPSVRAQGPTVAALQIGGTIPAPDVSGFLQITGADAAITSPRLQAEKLNVRLDLTKDRVTLSQLTGTLNGGALKGSGGVTFRGTGIAAAAVVLTSTGVYLDFPANLKTMSNANVFLRTNGNRYLLGGTVSVVDGSYTETLNLDQGLLNALNSTTSPEAREDRSPLLERLDYGVAIKTQHPLVVDNNLAKAELEMDARLTGSYYRPGLVGRITIDEGGSLNLNERNYIIDRGVLTFTDENKIDPSFDIVAKTQASGYDVTLSVQGFGKDRQTTLTSDPPLPEPDVAAVLLTGRTLEELSGREGDVAKEQVLSYLTGRVGGTLGRGIERATGISQVRIEPNLIANESDPSARLTIGQNFTRQLGLIYSMNLTDSGDQILVGQYDISKRFRTRALKQSDNTYRFDFSRKQEFGGTPPAPTSTAEREQKKVGTVAFTGEQIFSKEQLAKWLAARQGRNYDFFRIRRGVERITAKHAGAGHLEARVRLTRSGRDRQVDLDLNVEPGPKVDFVYEGYRPDGGVQRKIREQWLAGVFDAQRADEASSLLRADLFGQGYLASRIDHAIETPELNRKRIIFDVQPGEKFNTPKLVFAGAKQIEEPELRGLLRERKLTLSAFERPELAIDALTFFYRDRGFLDAKIAKPEIVLDAPAKSATIIYPVVEGPLYKVGRVSFSGNQAYPEADLQKAVTLEDGLPYLPELREETISNLRDLYGRRGYNDAELTYTLNRHPDSGRVDVAFQIAEGAQSVVSAVNITGNDATSTSLVRNQLEVKPGDPLDMQALSHSRRNLYATGAYSLIDIQRNALEPAIGKTPVSLDVHVREVRPFQMSYGAYFDTERGPGGIVDFANHNSLGAARVIGVRARYDADLQESRLYFSQPLLKRFPLRTTASTFVRREVREGFNTDRLGFSLLQEARFRKSWLLNYGYRLERTHTYDIGPDPIFDATLRVAPFTASLSRDTRDDLLDATRGSFLSHAVEYAPTFSGSELNFAKYFGQYFRYIALSKPQRLPMQNEARKSRLVFATGVRIGLAGGLNGQDLIPGRSATNRVSLGERFFAGGGTTIRGFAQDGVGPRLFDGVSPAGGNALFILNNEIRFPLASIFDGVAFVDVGNVYDRLGDFRPWSARKAGGIGIRIRTPYFLIRLDYGFKLDRRPGEPLGRPFFSIGQAF